MCWSLANGCKSSKRDPDAQSPTGGVSSSVNDLTKWLQLQLANGKFEDNKSSMKRRWPKRITPQMLTGFNPFTQLPTFYGLGWNVGYDQEGRLRLNHSGAFGLGTANLCKSGARRATGIVVLTNAYPLGISGSTRNDLCGYSHCMANPLKIGFRCLNRCIPTRQRLGRCLGSIIPNHRHRPTPALKIQRLRWEIYERLLWRHFHR